MRVLFSSLPTALASFFSNSFASESISWCATPSSVPIVSGVTTQEFIARFLADPAAILRIGPIVVVVGYAIFTDRLKADCAACASFSEYAFSSISSSSGLKMTPSSYAARRSSPIKSGCISSRASIVARLAGTVSPAFATVFVSLITTFPLSIAAGIPAFCSSPTIGPGGKDVGPFSTVISVGVIAPARIGAEDLLSSSIL